jgi:hypothetical protein
MKTCTVCKKDKPLDQFNKNRARKDGLQTLCKDCTRERFKVYYANNREKQYRVTRARNDRQIEKLRGLVFEYLQTHPCVDCGETDIRVLEFDHLPEFEKVTEVTRLISGGYSVKAVFDEIAKCEVRCRNHHAIKTYERMGGSWHDNFLGL